MSVEKRRLGSFGPEVSAEGLGCMGMTFGYGEADAGEAVATVHRALELGVNLLDTADMYGPGSNEELVGKAIAGRRDDIVLCSKVGNEIGEDGQPTGRLNGRPEYLRKAVEGSLRRLGTDRLDLYYLHRVDPEVPVEETVGGLAELVEAGKIRAIGLSEASAATIRRAHAVHPITALQTEYSLFTRDVEVNGVLSAVRELGIGFVAYSPLGRGLLTGMIRSTDDIPQGMDFRRIAPRFEEQNLRANLPVVDALTELAERIGASVTQLALAWVLAQGNDVIAIPGTKRRKYLEENIAAAAVSLSPEHLAQIDAIAPPGITAGERYPAAFMAHINS